ncbi:RNA polymerase factor sigma-54 [Peribacillus loiseleuriae]|uniref:RNA polymerase factor sigma-54 n=1 Tax=Peribacillus loiseleuriae TaxID=1679170 RepID=UPI003821B810
MKPGLYQQQVMKLTMTQELSQAIALLQYSTQELLVYLETKWLENPLLTIESSTVSHEIPRDQSRRDRLKNTGVSTNWIEQIGEELPSLEKYLLSQIGTDVLNKMELKAFIHLIRNIDENGYLRINLEDAATLVGSSVSVVFKSLDILQQLEPHGIGARNLQECLLNQVCQVGERPLAEKLLRTYFLPFVDKKWKELSKDLGVSLKEIQDEFDYIQTLNPRPGAIFTSEKPSYIVPDVIVEYKDGKLVVGQYEGNTLQLHVNEPYLRKMQNHRDPNVNRFLQEKWQEYQWLSKGILQRKETVLQVMIKIVEKQPEYFFRGLGFLKPMTMKEIADDLEIHESTVSRAVRGKYVQTSFGTVEMRSFFSSALQSTEQEVVSGTKVKNALQTILELENKQKPHSDQELAEILRDEYGVVLSRRTVAKYREQLGILSSTKRKRY